MRHGTIQRYGTRPISDDVRAIGAVVEGGFYQGTGLRRRVPSDKNRPRNAGIRGQTDATARSIPSRGNELQSSREAVAHPFLGAKSTRYALQIGEYDPRIGGCRAANRRAFRRVSEAMVAKITTGKDVYGALAYNQRKVDRGKDKVLLTHILREPSDGRFDVTTTAEDLLRWMPSHYRTEKPVVHVSLNPDPEDRLTAEQLSEIAEKYMERMGWGEQPYIVFEHSDIDRRHIHIVSVQVGQDGRKVKDSKRNERSVAVTEELEREYGLHPAKERKRSEDWRLTAVDSTKGDLKRQIGAVVKPAATLYRFQTLGEFRALLAQYNIGVEEVRGERGGIPYRGLLYTVLDKDGNKAVAAPLKSFVFEKNIYP